MVTSVILSVAAALTAVLVPAPKVKRVAAKPVISAEILSPFETQLLAAHNIERTRLDQQPLVWNKSLAVDARRWAEQLAKTGQFEHAQQSAHGENLWMGTKGAYQAEDMVGLWIDERAVYVAGAFPHVSTTGNWADVGHYTQVIWYSTRQVGCALASNQADSFLVCRYDPPGNWIGERPIPLRKDTIMPKKVTK